MSESSPKTNRGRLQSIGLGACFVLLLAAAGIGWGFWRGARQRDRVPFGWDGSGGGGRLIAYAGERACAECHPGESALQKRSGHARTLERAAETAVARWLDGQTVADPERAGVSWSYTLRDHRLSVERREADQITRSFLDYAFGSGTHAVTFVSMTDRDPAQPEAIEHRLTCYTATESLDVTPGHEASAPAEGTTPIGRSLGSSKALRCFQCHTTLTSSAGPRVLDVATMIPNVSCERCHGPARGHVEAARKGDRAGLVLGAKRWTADDQMRLCGECHRHPDQVPTASIRTDNIEIVRQQPIGLMQSACYRRSDGALGCANCHDPHGPTSRDRAGYENVCLSCHAAAPRTTCRVSPKGGCLDCHMPRRNSGQGILFTDHWIRIVKEKTEVEGQPAAASAVR